MDARAAAEKLGTDSKKLRRFLRQYNGIVSPGSGGKYDLSPTDISRIRKPFEAWCASRTERTPRSASTGKPAKRVAWKTSEKRMSTSFLTHPTRADLEERDRLSRERVDRLEARLRETGMHISQMKDREWRRIPA